MIERLIKWAQNLDLPILTQEIRTIARRRRLFVAMLLCALLLAVAAIVVFYFFGVRHEVQGRVGNRAVAIVSEDLFSIFAPIAMAIALLIIPVYSSRTITAEVENGTFELLALTPLSSWSIVLQKLIVSILKAFIYIGASIPIMAVALIFNGTSPRIIVQTLLALIVMAFFYGSVGLLCSCYFRSSRSATLAAYLVIFFTPGCLSPGQAIISLVFVPMLTHITPLGAVTRTSWMFTVGSIVQLIVALGVIFLILFAAQRKISSLRRC